MVDPRFAFNGASSVPNTAPPPPRLAGGIIKNDVAEELMNQETESRFQRQITNHQLQSTAKDPFTKSLPLGRPTDDTQRQLESEITASQRVKPQFNTPKEKRGLFDRVGAAFTDAFDSTITRNVKGLTRGLIGTVDSGLSFAEMIGFNKGSAKDEIAGARSHLQEWRDNLQVEDPTFVDTLAEGAGSALAFYIPGGAVMKGSQVLAKTSPTAARWFGASASAFLEASAEAGGVFEEGQRMGMTESEAKMAGWKTFAVNAVLVGVTNRFSLFGDQKKLVKRALNNMGSEGLQEFLQQVTSNVTLEKGDWDEGAYQAAGIGAILGPILGAVDIADGPQPTKAQQFAEATSPEATAENYGLMVDSLHDEGLITDKRYEVLQKRRGELQLKQDSKGREGIEIPKAPEQRLPGQPVPEIETQARLGKRGPEAEARLPGVKGDESIVPGEGENIDDVPLSEFSPQGKQDAADTQKLVDKGVDPREAVKEVSNNQTAIGKSAKKGRQTTKQPEIKTLPSEFRDRRAEVRERVKIQNEKIDDVAIRQQRADDLLKPESIDEIITRGRGIVTIAEQRATAQTLQLVESKLRNPQEPLVFTGEQAIALKQHIKGLQETTEHFKDLGRQFAEGKEGFSDRERSAVTKALDSEHSGKNLDDKQLLALATYEHNIKRIQLEMTDFAVGTETGRALQARKADIDSVSLRLRSIYNRIKALPSDQQQAVVEQIGEIDIENSKEYMDLINDLDRSDKFDKFAEWTVAVKLWNPTTQAVNLGGNALRQVMDLGVTGFEAAITGDTTLFAMDIMGARVGMSRGARNAAKVFTEAGYAEAQSKYLETGGKADSIKGLKGRALRLPFKLLTAGDEFFKGVAYDRALYRNAWLKSGKNKDLATRLIHGDKLTTKEFVIREKIQEIAVAEAKKMTFQEDMGRFTRMVNEARSPDNFEKTGEKVLATALRTQLPFLKTPVNIFKQGAWDFGGIGLYSHLTDSSASNSDKIRRSGEAVIGLGMMATVYSLIGQGLITGAPPDDKKERTKFYDVEKKLPYAVKIGKNWIQYKRAEPLAIVLGFWADAFNLPEDDPSFPQMINHAWYISAMQMQDKTYLSGIGNLMDLVSKEDWRRQNAFNDIVASNLFPSIVPHTARALDPGIKESKRMSLTEGIRSRIPGLSKKVTPMVSVYGNDVTRANKGLMYFFNPIQIQDAVIDDPVSLELINLDHMISLPGTRVGLAGENIQLNRDQYELYSRMIGTVWHNVMLSTVQTAAYKNLGREDRIKIMDSTKTKITRISSKLMASEAVKDSIIDEAKLGKKITDEAVLRILGRGAPPPRFVK